MRNDTTKIYGVFKVSCFGADGKLKWQEEFENLVVNEGLNYFLDVGLLSGTQITSWYVGLTDGTPTVAASDTMASHTGWTEVTAYSETTRQAYNGTRTNQTVSNSSSKATFSINASTTVGGAFICSASDKGGTTGTLLAAGAFTGGDRSLQSGDTLNVQYDITASSS